VKRAGETINAGRCLAEPVLSVQVMELDAPMTS
jgi:hypothetical protein